MRTEPSSPDPHTVPLEELDRLWDFADPAASETRFLVAAERAREESTGVFLSEALTQLARVRVLLERGRVANSANRDGRGRRDFLAAWEAACAAGEDALAVDAAHMLGIVEPAEIAATWNERAMELAHSSPDPAARRWVGSLASNMGWARHDAGDDDGAIALFELARDEWLADGRIGRARVARWSIARCLRSRGDVSEALASQQLLLAELDALGETDGYVLEEIAEGLLALGRDEEAQPFLARARAARADGQTEP